jgi:ribosomal protein S18 acetylase RimI-like enzyme
MIENKVGSEYSVVYLTPDNLDNQTLESRGLTDLMRGYPREYSRQWPLQRFAQEEYIGGPQDKDRLHIFMSENAGQAAATLTLADYSYSDVPHGKIFWAVLRAQQNPITEALFNHPLAYEVQGIVTAKDHRRKGLQRQLMTTATKILQPSVILGLSRTPEQVQGRTEVLGNLGYRTYFGSSEITPGSSGGTIADADPFIIAYRAARLTNKISSNGLLLCDTSVALPDIPDTTHVSRLVQESFLPLIKRQEEVQKYQTVMQTLISIKI